MSDDIDNLSRERDNAAKLAELSLKEIYKLKKEVAKLKAELSTYKEGIEQADADKNETYIVKGRGEFPHLFAAWDCDQQCWYISRNSRFDRAPEYITRNIRLYPLPHQQKEES